MRTTVRAALAAAGALLLCGHALSQERIRLPRKGSSPGFEMRFDGNRRIPHHGGEAGPSWEERERGEPREMAERRDLERRERLERLERQERRERQEREEGRERQEARARDCRKLARRARAAQEEAKQKVIIGYLTGGLMGAFLSSSQNDDAYKEPKALWDEVYNNCMGWGQQDRGRQDRQNGGRDDDGDNDGSGNGNGNRK
jgi:hypothetical protein